MKMVNKVTAIVLILLLAVSVSALPVFAEDVYKPNDARNTDYYTAHQSLLDFESQTGVDIPSTGVGSCYSEESGNVFWKGYRNDTNSAVQFNSSTANGFTASKLGTGNVEWTVQYKVRFGVLENATNSSLGNMTLGFNCSQISAFKFVLSGIDFTGGKKADIKFAYKVGSASEVTSSLGSYEFSKDVWYTFRQIYNWAEKTVALEICDTNGIALASFAYDVSAVADGQSWGLSNLNWNFNSVRFDFSQYKTADIDDFIIVKAKAKPVAVTANEGGKVVYNEAEVQNTTVAIPYNSSSGKVFSIIPDEGYIVDKIVKDGVELSADIDSVSYTYLRKASTLDVTFKKMPETPEIVNNFTYTNPVADATRGFMLYTYSKLIDFSGSSDAEYGIYIWKGTAEDKASADVIKLSAHKSLTEIAAAVSGQQYAIAAFGDEIKESGTYSVQAFVGENTGNIVTYTYSAE